MEGDPAPCSFLSWHPVYFAEAAVDTGHSQEEGSDLPWARRVAVGGSLGLHCPSLPPAAIHRLARGSAVGIPSSRYRVVGSQDSVGPVSFRLR